MQTHRRLRLIHRFGFFEFLRFLKQFRITANACYIFPMCHTATLRSGNLAFQQVPFTTNRRYLMAKVQRKFGTAKLFLIKSQKNFLECQKKCVTLQLNGKKGNESESQRTMDEIQRIYNAIAHDGFADTTLQIINNYVNDILYGRKNLSRFTIEEHAGLCTAGEVLIGASIVASYAAASFTAGGDAAGSQEGSPANWEIDERQEKFIEQWAKAARLWVEDSEQILTRRYGPKIAQGAEAKVYYREGDTSVVKERTSIYSTTQKALDAIALHNYLFPETAMHVVGFTRDSDNLMRMILTQPYVRCLRLATKDEIDQMVAAKGFHDNWNGQGVNYISDRLALEDMHPANVFIDEVTARPICIDCIVKFVQNIR